MPTDLNRVITLVWMVVFTVWIAFAYDSDEPVQRKSDWRSRVAVGVVTIAWGLLLFRRLGGPLAWRIVPSTPLLLGIGFVLTLVGLAFALWSRYYLGRNWDAFITFKQNHQLIRTGPYGIVRHPIYAGFMLASIGTALAVGQLRCFIGAVLLIVAWGYKSGLEEAFLIHHFGGQYEQYCREVKRLIPHVW